MLHTMADRSSNEADFLCFFLYLAWRLWKACCDACGYGEYYLCGRVLSASIEVPVV
jgi:hypothetical protein